VDYVQLMQARGRFDNRTIELGSISRSLKGLAKELNVPILVISQLSRAPESRSDHRPMLSDLRESGALEQDADVVVLLFRADQYPDAKPADQGIAELHIAKQRNGPTGLVKLRSSGSDASPIWTRGTRDPIHGGARRPRRAAVQLPAITDFEKEVAIVDGLPQAGALRAPG
jgi:hypothetical protein